MDMKLEVLVVPVPGVDRAKRFYQNLGFRVDVDYTEDAVRVNRVGSDRTPGSFKPPRGALHESRAIPPAWCEGTGETPRHPA